MDAVVPELFVKGRVHEVDILLAQTVLRQTQAFAEPLEVHDLPGTEEADDIVYIGIVAEAENVVVGDAGFLLCRDRVRTTLFIDELAFCKYCAIMQARKQDVPSLHKMREQIWILFRWPGML